MRKCFPVFMIVLYAMLTTVFAQVTPGDPKAVPVEFIFYHTLSKADSGVGINGSMNGWTGGVFKMKEVEPGFWKTMLELQQLVYEYKFVTYKDTVGQNGVTGYYTDPLNSKYGGPFANSYATIKDPMIYYFLPVAGSTVTNDRPTITAKIAVANSSKLNVDKIRFYFDGVEIANAKNLYNAATKSISFTPTEPQTYSDHTADLVVYNDKGDSAVSSTTFTIASGLSIQPYTFIFDSKSPNFNFLSTVNKVDIKGTFNQEGLSNMADPDGDGVFSLTANLHVNKAEEYTVIINGGSYINDPDNPSLSSNHRTQVIKRIDGHPKYTSIVPAQAKIFAQPLNKLTVIGHMEMSDSLNDINIISMKAKLDGNDIPGTWSSSGAGYDYQVDITNPAQGRHVLEFFGSDIFGSSVLPTRYVFGVYPQESGFHYVDGEADDKGDGKYTYPASIPTGSADIKEVGISANKTNDSLVFSIKMGKISDFSRLGFYIVNRLGGSYINAPQNAGIRIPDWNGKGIYATISSPSSAYLNAAEENILYVSANPLQTGKQIKIDAAAITGNEFKFSISLADLEGVLGTYKNAWYFGAYSFLKSSGGTVKVDPSMGGQTYAENPNVWDAAFFTETKIQERLLANYNPSANTGGVRIAAIGSNERGSIGLKPLDISSGLGTAPEVTIYADGGDLIVNNVDVAGYADAAANTTVTVSVNGTKYTTSLKADKTFTVNVPLTEGSNKITASIPFGTGRTSQSQTVLYNSIKDHNPVVSITASAAAGQATLNGAATVSPDALQLTYAWSQDASNPAQVSLSGTTSSTATFNKPSKNGEYYFTLTAKDPQQRSGWGRTVVLVTDSGMVVPDYKIWHPSWVDTAIIYCVFVRTFDPAGNFKAITARMSEIKSLGVNCFWLLPVHPTTGNLGPDNPGYAITDYLNLLEQYGTKEEFKTFVQTAHQYGIRVVMDHVIQHTSDLHPFMKDAKKYKKNSPYYPFYLWDANDNFQYLFTWVDLPSINYDSDNTKNYLARMAKYWMHDFDIDGYRCDVAHYINDLRSGGAGYWQRFRKELKALKPDILLLAEADSRYPRYFDAKFDLAYDWNWFTNLKSVISNTGTLSTLDSAITYSYSTSYPKDARPFRFLENQDEQRFIDAFGIANTKLAAAFLFTMPGVPMLYAGQEVGEETYRGDIKWSDPHGLKPYYKKLIDIRKKNPALAYGDFTRIPTNMPNQVYSFLRTYGNNNVITVANFGQTTVTATLNVPINKLAFDSTASFYLNDYVNTVSIPVKGKDLKNLQLPLLPDAIQVFVLSTTRLTDVAKEPRTIPTSFTINQNYPNPFNPSTTIRYAIPFDSRVKINVYNILGQRVTELVNRDIPAGNYEAVWNARSLASGIYMYVIEATPKNGAPGFTSVKKMVLLK